MAIYYDNPDFRGVNNFKLWRYMDLPTFISLLSEEKITFVRTDLFEDRFEGILPKMTSEGLDEFASRMIYDGKLHSGYKNLSIIQNNTRLTAYLSCWCKQDFELVHMWKIYSKINGLAIETDYESLADSIDSDEFIRPCLVKYIDYNNDNIGYNGNGLLQFTLKRREYKSENEFRLIMTSSRDLDNQFEKKYKTNEIGSLKYEFYKNFPILECPVNIHTLIKKIHLSPYAPAWYKPILEDIINKYSLKDIEVSQSYL